MIQSVLQKLSALQQPNGSFLTHIVTKDGNIDRANLPIFFPNTLVLHCLLGCHDPLAQTMKERLAVYILSQKTALWTFNYWEQGSEIAKERPLPDDLDDTFSALSALFRYNASLIPPDALAHAVSVLTHNEIVEGGPYKTWILPEDADKKWEDVDVVVNSTIAYFLKLQQVTLPKVKQFLEEKIQRQEYTTKYYDDPRVTAYFLSRGYTGRRKIQIRNFLTSMSSPETQLQCVIRYSALVRLQAPLKATESLVTALMKEDEQPYPLYIDEVRKGENFYVGSPALTLAYTLEALCLFEEREKRKEKKRTNTDGKKNSEDILEIQNAIVDGVLHRLQDISPEVLAVGEMMIERLKGANETHKIVLLPYLFDRSLQSTTGKNIRGSRSEDSLIRKRTPALDSRHRQTWLERLTFRHRQTWLERLTFRLRGNDDEKQGNDGIVIALGMGNLYGWMAYTIYDDFFDGEGNAKLLSVANSCLRELTTIYAQRIKKYPSFQDIFRHVMDGIDAANAWEVQDARVDISHVLERVMLPGYGDLGVLARRSMGHALGPLFLLHQRGYTLDDHEYRKIHDFFYHTLIARQLDDDLHDWKDDLKQGIMNCVGVEVLRVAQQSKDINQESVKTLLKGKRLDTIAWDGVIQEYSLKALDHIAQARSAYKQTSIIRSPDMFEQLLAPSEKAVTMAIEESKKTKEFLDAYA